MNRYEAEWFDHGEWRHIHLELIAKSEIQVRRLVDGLCSAEWRDKPYKSPGELYQDTLKVKLLEEVKLPYVLREY